MSLCNKIKYLNHNIFRTRCCKPLIFLTLIIWFNRIHSLNYLRSTTFGSKDIVIRKSGFVAETQFLYLFTWSKHRFVQLQCLHQLKNKLAWIFLPSSFSTIFTQNNRWLFKSKQNSDIKYSIWFQIGKGLKTFTVLSIFFSQCMICLTTIHMWHVKPVRW